MLKSLSALLLSAGLVLGMSSAARAQSSGTVNPGGTLTVSTASNSFENMLNLVPGTTTGFNFSGMTGSYSPLASGNGYYYAEYLFSFSPTSDVEAATITLNNPSSGVMGLTERLYRFTGAFLGDVPAGGNLVQAWIPGLSFGAFTVASLDVANLTGGLYVLEIRGTNQGSFGGTISFATPVPEPEALAMLLAGLGLMSGVGLRRRFVSAA